MNDRTVMKLRWACNPLRSHFYLINSVRTHRLSLLDSYPIKFRTIYPHNELPCNPHVCEVLANYPLHFQMKNSAIILFWTANYNERNCTAATFTGEKYNFRTSLQAAFAYTWEPPGPPPVLLLESARTGRCTTKLCLACVWACLWACRASLFSRRAVTLRATSLGSSPPATLVRSFSGAVGNSSRI